MGVQHVQFRSSSKVRKAHMGEKMEMYYNKEVWPLCSHAFLLLH